MGISSLKIPQNCTRSAILEEGVFSLEDFSEQTAASELVHRRYTYKLTLVSTRLDAPNTAYENT
jgi:hypothetical protein